MGFGIRKAVENDISRMLDIWATGASSANGIAPAEREFEYLRSSLRDSIGANNTCNRCWVADLDGVVVGWQILHPCRANPFFHDRHVESSTYTIRRSGVPRLGTQLLSCATCYADSADIDMIIGFVKDSNLASIRIMKHCGFQRVGPMPLVAEAAEGIREIWYYDATNRSGNRAESV